MEVRMLMHGRISIHAPLAGCDAGYDYDTVQNRANELLNSKEDPEQPAPAEPTEPAPEPEQPATDKLYRVQVGAFAVRENAEKMLRRLKDAGFEGYIREG